MIRGPTGWIVVKWSIQGRGRGEGPSYEIGAKWAQEAWKEVPNDMIVRGFKQCGYSSLSNKCLRTFIAFREDFQSGRCY